MRAIIIPEAEALNYNYEIIFEWWWGIRAIEKADGDFFLLEEVLNMIPVNFQIKISNQDTNLKSELSKYPIKDLKKEDFKVYELEDGTIITGK